MEAEFTAPPRSRVRPSPAGGDEVGVAGAALLPPLQAEALPTPRGVAPHALGVVEGVAVLTTPARRCAEVAAASADGMVREEAVPRAASAVLAGGGVVTPSGTRPAITGLAPPR